ncbi:MAG: peptidoglycan-associated lipoprotein Pal [Gammaproteobacteria bacterium]|nr:peptidoglycan-associated lipoprotein Pal [Gammaproteobacteria bacterium]
MRKFLSIFLFSTVFLFVGCTHTPRPSDMYGSGGGADESVMTSGTGTTPGFGNGRYNEENLINTQAGPHEGLLAKRSYYFDFDSNEVRQSDYPAVKAHARYLIEHKNARIVLQGNADIRGSREYNIALGQRRADAVADILKMQGVASKQIRTISFGAEKPIATGHTEEDYQLNRRVDIVYTLRS